MNVLINTSFWRIEREGRVSGMLRFPDNTGAIVAPTGIALGKKKERAWTILATCPDMTNFVFPDDAIELAFCERCGCQEATTSVLENLGVDEEIEFCEEHGIDDGDQDYRNADAEWIANAYGSDEED